VTFVLQDCHRFAKEIEKALADMKALYIDYQSHNGSK
jgi:hypothetical protein